MKRTPEQIQADEALTSAIEAAIVAYQGEDGAVCLEYVVVVARQRIDEEGETEYSFDTIYRDGQVATTRVLGLLRGAEKTLSVGGVDE